MIVWATLALLGGLTIVFALRPAWGLVALLFALPFERIGAWPLNADTGHPVVRLSQVVAAAWLAGLAINAVLGRVKLRCPAWPWYLLAAFVGAAGVSAALVGVRQLWVSYVIVLLVAATATALAVTVRRDHLPRMLDGLLAGAGVVSLFGLYQFVMGTFRVMDVFTGLRAPYIRDLFGFPRIHSTALEPLYYANYLMIPLLVGLALLLVAPKSLRTWHRVVIGLVAINFLLTMSRGAFIAAVPAIVLIVGVAWWLQRGKLAWKTVAGAAAAVLAAGVLAVGAASYVATGSAVTGLQNFGESLTVDLFRTGSFIEREEMRELGLEIARSNPLWGVGLAGITPYLKGYGAEREPNDVVAINNQAVELLAETGIIGAGLFYGFLAALLVTGIRRLRALEALPRGWLLGGLGLLVGLTLQAQTFSGFLLMHLWVVYGLVLALIGLDKAHSGKITVRERNS